MMREICTPANEYDAFAFTNAIMDGKQETALSILSDYRFRRIEPVIVLGEVTRVISEMISVRSMAADGTPVSDIATAFKKTMPEFKVKLYLKSLRGTSEKRLHRAMEACLTADMELKASFKKDSYSPLEKLICSL